MKDRNKNGTFKKGSIVTGKEHNRYKHGMCGTRPYRIWWNIKRRCSNKKDISYQYYGGRGIKVCDDWLDFQGFWRDMENGYSDKLSIDRLDNSKGYSKDNCRWATDKQQSQNRDIVKTYLFNGEHLNLSEISKITGIKRLTLRFRLNSGWSEEKAFTTKVSFKNKNLKNYD